MLHATRKDSEHVRVLDHGAKKANDRFFCKQCVLQERLFLEFRSKK